jgi:hypothetical protein
MPPAAEPRRPAAYRRVVVVLSEDELQRLTRWADHDTRTPDQQAAHLIRRALRRSAPAETRTPAPAGGAA